MTTEIPKPPGVPLIGNVFDIDPHNTWPSFKKLADDLGEIFKIQILGKQIVFVASVDLCDEICDTTRFRKAVEGPVVEIRHSVHDSLFTAFNGEPSWGIAHRIMAPLLSKEYVENYFKDVSDVAKEFTAILTSKDVDKPKNMHDYIAREALESVTLALYGKKLGNMEDPKHPMIDAMEAATSEAMLRPTRPGIINRLVYQKKFDSSTEVMRSYARDVLEYRRAHPELAERKDILTAMMTAKDPETGTALDEQRIIDEIVTLPIGLTTAPALMATIVFYLLHNTQCITKAREEIESVTGGEPLKSSQLPHLKYVDGIVKESMRLCAPAPGFNIEPIPTDNKAPVLLAGGKYSVPHDQTMITVLAAVGRDPKYFTNPEIFDPDRMTAEKFDALPKGAKRFFGNGQRECIGKHFAWTWLMVLLVQLLKDVDFEKADPAYALKQDGWFNVRPVGFEVLARAKGGFATK